MIQLFEDSPIQESLLGALPPDNPCQSSASTSVAQSVERIAQMAEQSTATATATANESAETTQRLYVLAREMRSITDQYRL